VQNPFAVDPFKWLRDLVARLEKGDEPQEFLEHVKLDMFTDQVFCFTPEGDVVGLPRGATPIDFAYAIHTNVGDRCAGALVDGRRVPLWTRLRNGQQIEIITAKGQTPSSHWEDMAQTGRAKAAIRRALRERLREEQIGLGGDLAEQSFARAGRSAGKKAFAAAAAKLGFASVKAMLVRLATGEVTGRQVVEAVYPSQPDGAGSSSLDPAADATPAKTMVRGIRRGAAINFCTCCWPIPGDRIIGLSRRGGVMVHAISCPLLAEFENDLEHWHDLSWDPEASKTAANVARIDLTLANQPGTLGTVCTLIGEQHANIDNLGVTLRKPDFFLMSVDLEVRDVKHLSDILTALRAQSFVNQVERAISPPERRSEEAADEQPRLPLGSRPAAQH
jgi:(p)ppGpp synthase/HD superfamily hydrolase